MQHHDLSATAIVIWITSALKMDNCFHYREDDKSVGTVFQFFNTIQY